MIYLTILSTFINSKEDGNNGEKASQRYRIIIHAKNDRKAEIKTFAWLFKLLCKIYLVIFEKRNKKWAVLKKVTYKTLKYS